MPTSTTAAPGFTISAVTARGRPMAATRISASRARVARPRLRLCAVVTVASAQPALSPSSSESGRPTIWLRPSTTTCAPANAHPRRVQEGEDSRAAYTARSRGARARAGPGCTGAVRRRPSPESIASDAASGRMCAGSGSCTRIPCTAASRFASASRASRFASDVDRLEHLDPGHDPRLRRRLLLPPHVGDGSGVLADPDASGARADPALPRADRRCTRVGHAGAHRLGQNPAIQPLRHRLLPLRPAALPSGRQRRGAPARSAWRDRCPDRPRSTPRAATDRRPPVGIAPATAVSMRRRASSLRTPMIESCAPVIPASVRQAVPRVQDSSRRRSARACGCR